MSDRHRYVITYDITDPKRLRRVFRTMKEYGQHTQYSVFIADLNRVEQLKLKSALLDVVNLQQDTVMFVDVGPATSTAPRITHMGLQRSIPDNDKPTIL